MEGSGRGQGTSVGDSKENPRRFLLVKMLAKCCDMDQGGVREGSIRGRGGVEEGSRNFCWRGAAPRVSQFGKKRT